MRKELVFTIVLLCLMLSGSAQDDNAAVPAKPIQLVVSAVYEGSDTIGHLKWRDMSDNELGFEIHRTQGSGDFQLIARIGADTDNYKDIVGKYVSGAYTYKVYPFNQAGKGEASNEYTVWF